MNLLQNIVLCTECVSIKFFIFILFWKSRYEISKPEEQYLNNNNSNNRFKKITK